MGDQFQDMNEAATIGRVQDQWRLNELLGSVDVGIWYCDLPFDKLNWDTKVKEHFWLAPDTDVTIDLFYARLHPEDRLRTRREIERSLAEHTNYDIEYRTVSEQGELRWLRAIGRGFYNEVNEPIRFDGLTVDITQQRLGKQLIQRAKSELTSTLDRLRAALEASATGTFHWNIKTNELDWDESLDRLFGLGPGETVRSLEAFLSFVYPEDRAEVVKRCEISATTGADFEMEFRVVWPDGSVHWIYDRGKTSCNAQGQPVNMTGACVDITSRQETAWLLQQRAKISALGAEIGVALTQTTTLPAILRLCTDALVTHLDAAFARIWTLSERGDVLELQASSGMYTHLDGPHANVPVGRYKIGLIAEERLPHLTNDVYNDPRVSDRAWARREGLVAFAGYPLIVAERLVGVAAVFSKRALSNLVLDALASVSNSISLGIERKRSELRLQEAKEAAEAADRAKSDFLASMSHELRTPLNAIIGYGEMLQEEAEDLHAASLVPDLKKIHSAGKHLLSLINDILDISKIEAGRMELFVETFPVQMMVEETANMVRPLVEANGNRLDVKVVPGVGEMRTDQVKVRQSLFNLLSNAAKFTKGGAITVEVSTSGAGDEVLFEVRDTGIGLTPEQVQKLFQPFQQADTAISRRYGGTGLGLALTKRFCAMMGGTISVQSEENVGSVFTIRLPRAVPEARDVSEEATKAEPRIHSGVARGTVLIIDDDPTACDLIQKLVAKEGFDSIVALSGEEGLRLAREHRPNLITLDVMMPRMDGWTVLTSLKRIPELRDVPVFMLTMIDDRRLGYALGASEYLTKPVEREHLSVLLRKHRCKTPPCHALVVDDDETARKFMRQMLEREGWLVREAEDGSAALRQCEQKAPALVLLDLMMPGMDGFEFSVELKKRPEWRNIPVIVLTSKDLTDEDRARLNGHVERVLNKNAYTREQLARELQLLLMEAGRP